MTPMEKFVRGVESPKRALTNFKARMRLSEREAEVLQRKQAGDTLTAIAKDWGVTPPAVRRVYLCAQNKNAELKRMIKCPCCSKQIAISDLLRVMK